jgi:hypothetical protein
LLSLFILIKAFRTASGADIMKKAAHRGYLIYWSVEKPSGTEFWNARGRIEFYEGRTFCRGALNLTGKVNKFTSETDAEQDFLNKAKNWIDRRLRPRNQEPVMLFRNLRNR